MKATTERKTKVDPYQTLYDRLLRKSVEKRQRATAPRYTGDPVRFVTDRLGEHLWSKQIDIARSVAENRHTAVHACHGPGKSYTAARIIAWWIETYGHEDAFVVSTAPTFAQVRAILWRELRAAHVAGNLQGRLNQTEWWLNDQLVAMGRKPSDYDTNAFQGIHASRVLAVIDEAAGVPESIWMAVETIVTNEDSRVLAIGNPDDPSSNFAQKCRPGSGWNVIGISAYDTPAFTGEEVPPGILNKLISKLWVSEREKEWGTGSPLWISRVLGQFPEDGEETVVPMSWLRRCQYEEEDRPALVYEKEQRKFRVALGVDVGAGGDETTVCVKQGPRAIMRDEWRGRTPEPNQALGIVMKVARMYKPDIVNVDANGIGWALCELLRRELSDAKINATVNPVQVGEAASDPERFPRKRDELWWEVGRISTQNAEWDLTEVTDLCLGQLTAPKYDLDPKGRVRVEPKTETRKRLGRSPDLADALLLAFVEAPSLAASIRF